jgi:hypothetical protein
MTIQHFRRPLAAALTVACLMAAPAVMAQGVVKLTPPRAADAALPVAAAPAPTSVHVPEGAEVRVRFDDALSSATAATGDTFSVTTDEAIRLADGTVIPAGYHGKGEVTDAEKKGMMGKPGDLKVRLTYVSVGGVRMHLRASQGEEGKDSVTATIVLTVLFGPLGLIKHGHDVTIPKGQTLIAYVDEDTVLPLPIAAPPAG